MELWKLFERFEEVSALIDRMNAQALADGAPYVLLPDYAHYCDVRDCLNACTRQMTLPDEERRALLAFCYRDTLRLESRIGTLDLYQFTQRYFRRMTCRTGNLDTPDDCVERLALERLLPYRDAREKEWRGEALSPEERALLTELPDGIVAEMKAGIRA